MNYWKFSIKNFRCFAEEQTLSLAQPVEGRIGSGLTYIVGTNNSGKTTLIEALWIKTGHYLNDSERTDHPPEFKFYSDETTLQRTVRLLREEAHRFIEDPARAGGNAELFEIISSRRHWESAANGDAPSGDIVAQTAVGNNPRTQQSIATAVFLKAVEADTARYEAFTKLVQRVIPDFSGWAIGYESHPYVKYITGNGTRHKSDFLGDGVISVIRILAHLFEERETGLIIDEPELSLHPSAQKKLIEIIAEYAEYRQIIISTHSPYFISWEYIANGAVLNRVSKSGDTSSEIHTLKEPKKYSGLVNGANWQQPFLMDEIAKEVFFAEDSILFLEGQEDVGLLRSEFANSDIHIFGYGVRGCGNFRTALTMAQDLGFQKAAVLLDKGDEEDALLARLTTDFSNYHIAQWNKNDIRDKVPTTFPEKIGYFKSDGVKKDAGDLDDFDAKLASLKTYFVTE